MSASPWLRQAVYDLRSAILLFEGGMWSNACIQAQQAVEKFGKGLLIHANAIPEYTHNVDKINSLIQDTGLHQFSDEEVESAKVLARTFLTARYPNLAADTAPCELFTKKDAEQHIQWAINYFDMVIHIAADLTRGSVPDEREKIQAEFLAAKAKHKAGLSCNLGRVRQTPREAE